MNKLSVVFLLMLLAAACSNHKEESLYVSRYKAVFTEVPKRVPTTKTPDGPLAGNGDIGLVMGGDPEQIKFYFGKNDFWRAYPVYPGGGIALPGGLDISINDLKDAEYYAENIFDEGYIKGRFTNENLSLDLKAWVSATHNTVVLELQPTHDCKANLHLWTPDGNTSVTESGQTGDITWVTRSFENTPLLEWPAHVALAMKVTGTENKTNELLTLSAGKKTIVTVTLYTNQDREVWKDSAIADAASIQESTLASMWLEHTGWWEKFWQKSHIEIGDTLLEKYYYASQYMLASSTRGDKFAPGIWGCYVTRDSAAWGGDYHLNYNYQAPFWASYASNHIGLLESFDQPLLDYMEQGRVHARELLNVRGIYYPVGIGPKGVCTTLWPLTPEEMQRRYATRENTIDGGYKFLGQKINAVFSVGNMLMRFYSTYDEEYARKVYPYMLACADFWEDYLTFENDKYVIYMDHFNEVMPNLRNKGQWRHLLGDMNSTLSLGLVRMLFKGMIDVSGFLQTDVSRRDKWEHICRHLSPYPIGETEDGRLTLKSVESSPGRNPKPDGLTRVSIHGLILPGGVCGPILTPELNEILLSDIEHWEERNTEPGGWGNTFNNGVETIFPGAVRVGYDPDFILDKLKERIATSSYPNLWIEAGGGGIETLAAVPMTINEMLLQSYEHVLRVFPVWNRTRDASFYTLRAYGAFLVSSTLKNNEVEFVLLQSEQGRPCKMENPWKENNVQIIRDGVKSETLSGDFFTFETTQGEEIRLVKASSN